MKQHNFNFPDLDSRPDFVAMEKERLTHWYRHGVVQKYLHKNDQSKKKFSFLDGPITANNPMGVHHGRGRTYKDLWQRYHTMKGERQRYQNGFDCQGLWVEVEVEKELGFKNKKDIVGYGVEKFVNKCKERVLKYAAVQTEQSKRLGMFMDWPNSYYTMSDENNYAIWNFLKVCHQRGWIYKGNDSVPWCPRCETAISQHEMLTEDYKEVIHKSIYLEYPVVGKTGESLIIWTTTPWTLPANIAVAVDKNIEYALVEGTKTGKRFWVAKEVIDRVFTWGDQKIIRVVKGEKLVGLKYRGPFDDLPAIQEAAKNSKFHTVVATDPLIMPISTSEGTGLVHTAVSAGSEDFQLGKKLGLPMIPVIEDNADYMPGLGEFSGKNAKKHPELIFDYLRKREKEYGESWVFEIHDYKHRYPACWRCKTELVWKVTDEWYVAMDKEERAKGQGPRAKGKTLREQLVEVAKKVKWIPGFGLERELDWLKNMHDWLISKKNRFWGLALPIWECDRCGHFEVIGGKNELRERSVKGWSKFDGHSPHKPWIDEVKITCESCGNEMSRVEPVGNPWLDAGIVPFSTMPTTPPGGGASWFPADFITESFPGQFKNWFYSLLVMSTVLKGEPSFKTVLGFESVTGEDGKPMHKSWGNMIEFNDGAEKIGVDVMRWMYAKAGPTTVLPFGYKTGDEIRRRFLLILWNSYRFFVTQANAESDPNLRIHPVGDVSPNGTLRPNDTNNTNKKLTVLDQWILLRLNETILAVTESLDDYQSAPATDAIEKLVGDFSTWYIRRSRSRVGAAVTDDRQKQLFYQTSYEVLVTLCKLIAPFMPYISDELYVNLTGQESVHLSDWPKPGKVTGAQRHVLKSMKLARTIVEALHAIRKERGIKVRQPLSSWSVEPGGNRLPDGFEEYLELINAEANIKTFASSASPSTSLGASPPTGAQIREVKTDSGTPMSVWLDPRVTPQLRKEGEARDIIRQIQTLRREANTSLTEEIVIGLPKWPKEFEAEIMRVTLAKKIEISSKAEIRRI